MKLKPTQKSFAERAESALLVYGMVLPGDIRQLLKDMAAAIDKLQEQQQ